MVSLPSRCLSLRLVTVAAGALAALGHVVPAQDMNLSSIGLSVPGFRIDGNDIGDYSGACVSNAGDVNGDGLADIIVGASAADAPGGLTDAGEVSVVFGRTAQTTVSLAFFTGFVISGAAIRNYAGASTSGAGDVNGDGLADVLVGAPGVDSPLGADAGAAYVVFGKTSNTAVRLSALGTQGFAIHGAAAYDRLGSAVSGAGDFNGDGLADLVIGAFAANAGPGLASGQVYVIHGRTSSDAIQASSLGTAGLRIDGVAEQDRLGMAVSGAGDVNGDGLHDVVLGAPGVDFRVEVFPGVFANRYYAGEAYVLFGRTETTSLSISDLGTRGFAIRSLLQGDDLGKSVSGAGDINGDGLADVVVGRENVEGDSRGEACVIFGRTGSSAIDVSNLGTHGFRVRGYKDTVNGQVYRIADRVDGAGDVNGDGLADIIIGAPGSFPQSGNLDGKSFVVFGKTGNGTVQFSSLGTQGFRLDGSATFNESGTGVSGGGDVNGDGLPDVLIGEPKGDVTGGEFDAGRSFVVFSPYAYPPLAPSPDGHYRATIAAGASGPSGVGCGRMGHDATLSPDSRAWVAFDAGTGPGNEGASLVVVAMARTDAALGGVDPNTTANVHWQVSTDRTAWSNCGVTLRYTNAEIAGLVEADLELYAAPTTAGPFLPLPDFTLDAARNRASGNLTALPAVLVLSTQPPATSLNGDAEGDFDHDIADLTAIHNQIAGITLPPLPGDGDVDNDSDVDLEDAHALREFLVNGTPLP